MAKEAYNAIMEGLDAAIDYSKGKRQGFVEHRFYDIDVKAIRTKLDMSQSVFAETFSISLKTLKHWEQKRRVPEGPARVLLRVIEHEPEAVKRALAV